MKKIGIIGGSAYHSIEHLTVSHKEMINTPYGSPSCTVVFGEIDNNEIVFIHRHGFSHALAPHEINYRANIWALKEIGVTHIIAISAVGGITENMSPLKLVFPDQIIDYTHSRKHTFFDKDTESVLHVDFSQPYSETIRGVLITSAEKAKLDHVSSGVYGATQGPRLETAAEIQRMERDGCTIVGMTCMPEAVLCRELDMEYACAGLVVNWAAGKGGTKEVSIEEIEANIKSGVSIISQLMTRVLPAL